MLLLVSSASVTLPSHCTLLGTSEVTYCSGSWTNTHLWATGAGSASALCPTGMHGCGINGDIEEVRQYVPASDCQSLSGKYVAAIPHAISSMSGQCRLTNTVPSKQKFLDFGCPTSGWGSEPMCCGTGCSHRPPSCGGHIFQNDWAYCECGANGCGNFPSSRANGIICCPDACTQSSTTTLNGICDCAGTLCDVGHSCYNNQCHDALEACLISNTAPTGSNCNCSGNSCSDIQFCYDGGCHDEAASACVVDYTTKLTERCYIPGDETEFCEADEFFYGGVCQTTVCPVLNAKKIFYGSKLHGHWDSDNRAMSMYLKTPHEVSITEIKWINATSTDLKYSSTNVGHWRVDTKKEPCKTRYYLNVSESDFFGTGSNFTLTGSQLRTQLVVKATRPMKEIHNGKTYTYDRSISNYVPGIVNLNTKKSVSITFTIPTTVGEVGFILFKDAEDNLDTAAKNIVLHLEVHSSNCVNNGLTNATFTNGTRIETGANYLVSGTTSSFIWKDTTGNPLVYDLCVQELTWKFVPKAEQLDQEYDITLEFATIANTKFQSTATIFVEQADVLDTVGFDATLELYQEKECTNKKTTFYMGDQFFAKVSLSNLVVDAATITCDEFNITQANPVTNAIEHTDLKADAKYNYQEFNFTGNAHVCSAEIESPHFHRTVEGYDTNLLVDVVITYESGTVRRRTLSLEVPMNAEQLEETDLGDEVLDVFEDEDSVGDKMLDDYYSGLKHGPGSKDLSVQMFIEEMNPLKAWEMSTGTENNGAASTFYEKYTKVVIISGVALFGGILLAGMIRRRKESNLDTKLLVEDEEI